MPETKSEIRVPYLPDCQICALTMTKAPPARYDFKTKQGPWAYGCEKCWEENRLFSELGMGKGQKLVAS